MGKGRREILFEKKLNIKKVMMLVIAVVLIILCIISVLNIEKIKENFNKESEETLKELSSEEKVKTIEEILDEFGGEVLETPKSDTYIVLKEEKEYTIYSDGEIIEGRVTFWDGQSREPQKDKDGNIEICEPGELKWVADKVIKGEENFEGKTITLNNSLDFAARIKEDGTWEGPMWTSIVGFLDELPDAKKEEKTEGENLKRFSGTFNGNGYSIRGICIESDKNYQGLFGYSTGIIENLILRNCYISGNVGTGAIVGLNAGTVRNCQTTNTIVEGRSDKVGGLVGISMTGSTIVQISTEGGKVSGKKYVGGLLGYINNNVTVSEGLNNSEVSGEEFTGGIAGAVFFGTTIENMSNSKKVVGKNYTGGIAGYSEAQLEKVWNISEIIGEEYTGGIVGANVTTGDISLSYNTGNVTGNNNVGGILGTNNATTSDCYNTGNVKANGYRAGGICGQNATESFVYNSYNIGIVEGVENIGGVIGGEFGTTTNCYYLDSIFEDAKSEQAKSEEDLKENMIDVLGSEFVLDEYEMNKGYPILKWQI